MLQTSTLLKIFSRKNAAKLLLLLLCCFVGVVESYGQEKLPITLHNGPWSSGLPEGWTQSGLGADYTQNIGANTIGGSARFDHPGDRITINVGSIPKEVSFFVRGANTLSSFNGEFIVEEAAADQVYTTVKSITGADKVGYKTSDNHGYTVGLSPATRYVRFRYVSQSASQYMLLDEVVVIAAKPEINLKQGATNIASGGTFDFGAKTVGETKTLDFTIENLGNYDLNLTGTPKIEISGANANEFTLDQTATVSPVLEGQSTTFSVTFAPTSEGNKTAVISIANDDADENPYTLRINAIGAKPGPLIMSFTPGQGYVNDLVTITGANFADVQDVSFNGVSTAFIVNDENNILAEVPAGATTGPISVTTISGTATSTDNFIINVPTIISFTPDAGGIGTSVTITGTHFVDVQNVRFNGVSATFIVKSDTEIQVVVPTGATTGPISVTTLSGSATSTENFVVLDGPTIISFTPGEGYVDDVVTITGTNFIDVQDVSFNGVSTGFMVNSENEIQAVVPAGATTGKISVTTLGGTATSTEDFIVLLNAPTIISFTPGQGSVDDVVTITGTNFVDVQDVSFNGVSTGFMVNSENEIQAVVPTGATTGKISVTTLGGTATSTEDFVIRNQKIFLSTTDLSFGYVQTGSEYVKEYQVSALDLIDGATILLSMSGSPGLYTMSESPTGGFARTLDLTHLIADNSLEPTYIYVKYAPIDAGTYNASISHTTEQADVEILSISGTATVTPLPVELMSFKAALQNNKVVLTWATASEQNNSHFEVEVSSNPKNGFDQIGRVDSKVTNSVLRTDYDFTHRLGNETGTIYYRLKQVDLDGTIDYSKVVSVNVKSQVASQQLMVAPNPINYNTKVFVTAEANGKANMVLYSMTGQKVYAKEVELQAGSNEVQLPVYDKLSKGMYVLKVELNGQVSQVKVMKE